MERECEKERGRYLACENEKKREREIERVRERERETKNVSDLIEKSYGFCYDNNGISKEHNNNKPSR